MADKGPGELHHYLLLIYRRVIEESLKKHSKRPSSAKVVIIQWKIDIYYGVLISGHGMVEPNQLLM